MPFFQQRHVGVMTLMWVASASGGIGPAEVDVFNAKNTRIVHEYFLNDAERTDALPR
jgi:hypothetical protein